MSDQKEDLYKILGINENANHDEIKKAYRGLSLKLHPDRNPDPTATEKFKKINEAYEVLGDEQKRKQYEMERKNPFTRMSNGMHGGNNMGEMDDILKAFFGGMPFMGGMGGFNMASEMEDLNGMGGMPGFPPGFPLGFPPGAQFHVFHNGHPINIANRFQKPSPINKTLSIDIEQVYNGATIPIDIERWINDNGTKTFEKETLYVSIPKGIDENEIIILKDKGNIVNEQCKGDVKIFIKITNNTEIKRNGIDLIYEKGISLKEALCGFTFEIKFINGKVYTLNNNSGNIITPEYKKIVPNMGLVREGHTGNLIVIFHIEFPEKLTNEQIKLLSETL
jgi:DnaJ-class molecular chaperone